MPQRLRESCAKDDDDDDQNGFLSSIIEADETHVGGKEMNRHASGKLRPGRGTVGKVAILSMRERGGRVIGRVLSNTRASRVLKNYFSTTCSPVQGGTGIFQERKVTEKWSPPKTALLGGRGKKAMDGLFLQPARDGLAPLSASSAEWVFDIAMARS